MKQQGQGEEDGDAESVDQAGQDVPAGVVRAQEMARGRRRRKRGKGVFPEVVFIGVEGHDGHEHPVPLLLGRKAGLQLPVIGLVVVVEAEDGAGEDLAVGGKVGAALVPDHQGLAVDEEFRRKGEGDHQGEEDEGDIPPPDGFEAADLLEGEGIEPHLNCTRGSTRATQMSERMFPIMSRREEITRMPSTTG